MTKPTIILIWLSGVIIAILLAAYIGIHFGTVFNIAFSFLSVFSLTQWAQRKWKVS